MWDSAHQKNNKGTILWGHALQEGQKRNGTWKGNKERMDLGKSSPGGTRRGRG